jgi:hypothetical protein
MKAFASGMMAACASTFLLGAIGCESPELSSTATTESAPVVEPAAEPAQPRLFTNEPMTLPQHENPATDVPRKFDKHDPIQGRQSTAVGGVAGNMGAALSAKHQGFIIAIDQANQLYWPQNDFSYPKSHEEFMTEVVALALNGQALPEIPEDEEYIYVPEQGEVGLQIRLIPGSPKSKIPPAEPGKEHIYDPEILAAAGVPITDPNAAETGPGGEPLSPDPRIRAQQIKERDEAAAGAAAGGETTEEQPVYDIRSRAEGLGEQGNSRIEEHGLAPGGLVPVGGIE